MSQKIFHNDLVTTSESKVTITLNKPAYIEVCIYIDLIKVLIYKFHCDYIKNKYGNNSRLLFTDTDSLMQKIKKQDVFKNFSKDKEMYDFTKYSAES